MAIATSRRVLVLIVVLSMWITACSNDDTFLPALLADPMADYEAEGIELIDAWEQAENPGFLGSKPLHAKVERLYRIEDQGEAERILNEAAAFAESLNWRLDPSPPAPVSGYRGAKGLTPGNGRLIVSLVAEDPLHDPDGPRVLRIHLDFGPVRFDDPATTTPAGS